MNPRTARSVLRTTMLGVMVTLATATAAMARPVTAYVVNRLDDTVTPIDLSTNTAGAAIPVGDEPIAIAITRDAAKAYVANGLGNSVTPIDLATNTAGPAIPVGIYPSSIAMSPDGRTAWVANQGNYLHDPLNGPGPSLTPIDTVTNTAGPSIPVPFDINGSISVLYIYATLSSDGTTLYVTGDTNVMPFDLVSRTFGTSTNNARDPRGSVLTPDGGFLLTSSW